MKILKSVIDKISVVTKNGAKDRFRKFQNVPAAVGTFFIFCRISGSVLLIIEISQASRVTH